MGEYVDSFQGLNGVQITLTRPLLDRRYTPPPPRRRGSKTRSSSTQAGGSGQPSFTTSTGNATINIPAGSMLLPNHNPSMGLPPGLMSTRSESVGQSPSHHHSDHVGSPPRVSLDLGRRSDHRQGSSHHRRSGTDRSTESVRHYPRQSFERRSTERASTDRRKAYSRKSRESLRYTPATRSLNSTMTERRAPSRA
jgi:hypothetical protein